MLGGVKGALAPLGGDAALDPTCAPRGLAYSDGRPFRPLLGGQVKASKGWLGDREPCKGPQSIHAHEARDAMFHVDGPLLRDLVSGSSR